MAGTSAREPWYILALLHGSRKTALGVEIARVGTGFCGDDKGISGNKLSPAIIKEILSPNPHHLLRPVTESIGKPEKGRTRWDLTLQTVPLMRAFNFQGVRGQDSEPPSNPRVKD